MRSSSWVSSTLKNVAILLIVIVPIFLLLSGLLARAMKHDVSNDLIGTAFVLLPAILGPMLLGAAVYLLVVAVVVSQVQDHERLIAVLLTPLMALGFATFSVRHLLTTSNFLTAFCVSALVFGVLIRVPAHDTYAKI